MKETCYKCGSKPIRPDGDGDYKCITCGEKLDRERLKE